MAIKVGQLAGAVNDILADYRDAIAANVDEAVEKTAEDTKQQLRQTSPKGSRPQSKSYRAGWRVKKAKASASKPEATVYNSQYRLTHLLEYGHALKGGGRTAAQPHIAPAEEAAAKEFEKLIKEGINDA